MFPVGERKVGWLQRDGEYRAAPGHKAIIRLNARGDNAHLLNIVGGNYKLVHNRELFTAVEAAMLREMLPEHIRDVRVTDRVSGFGRICLREYIFPSINCRLPGSPSDIGFRIIVQNGYGGSALRIHAGAIDFYCTNGMIRGEYTSAYKRHTSRLVVGGLNKTITDALHQFSEGAREWQRWSKTPVKHDKAMALFHAIAASAKMEEGLGDQYLQEREVRGDNLWAVYSTMTHYVSHPDKLRATVDEQDSAAITMLRHELDVTKWVRSKEWKQLETT
jgi:hypothetical protein